MNSIAADVENMVKENAFISQNLEEDIRFEEKKHRHRKRKHHKQSGRSRGDRPSNGNNLGLQESRLNRMDDS